METATIMGRPKKKAEEPDDEANTTFVRINRELHRMIAVVVKWKSSQPGTSIRTHAQYLESLLRPSVEADFADMVRAQAAQASGLSSRKPGRPGSAG